MAEVVWSRAALADLEDIRTYIAQDNPFAADRVAARLIAAARSLETNPDRGRPISLGRRELAVVAPYLIRYDHEYGEVAILEVRHTAREPG